MSDEVGRQLDVAAALGYSSTPQAATVRLSLLCSAIGSAPVLSAWRSVARSRSLTSTGCAGTARRTRFRLRRIFVEVVNRFLLFLQLFGSERD